ncbi:MAG: glycosyltransferase [Candidatus Magasanikbacteria bacterium]|nr:glycosyltransferase [Candidatus Magasanikbacteria bacterium]
MKIVLVNKFWYPRGGAEKVAILTKELLEQAGHTVEIFGMNHPENLFSNEYFTDFIDYNSANFWQKIKFGLRAIYNRQAARNFEKLLHDFQPDVVHFHNIYHQLSCSIIGVAKKIGIKTVMTLHDYKLISPNYNLYHHGQVAQECMGGKYYRCILHNCMESRAESWLATIEAYFVDLMGYKKMISKYLSPSEFLRAKFIESGFDNKHIEVLPNPLRASEFIATESAGNYVGYIGRLAPEKGVEYLLQAAEFLSGIKFKVAGSGPSQKYLQDLIEKNKLSNVELVGQKNGQDLQNFILQSRLLVVPSVWHENAPMSVVEAKAHSKVVVAFAMGGISEILPPELLVKPKDVLEWAQKIKSWFEADTKKLAQIGRQLQSEVKENNSPEVYLDRLLKVYKDEK